MKDNQQPSSANYKIYYNDYLVYSDGRVYSKKLINF